MRDWILFGTATVVFLFLVSFALYEGCVKPYSLAERHLQETAKPVELKVVDKDTETRMHTVYVYNHTTKTSMPQHHVHVYYWLTFDNGMKYRASKREYDFVSRGRVYTVYVGDWIEPGDERSVKRIARISLD
jgi:hypothetical protein